MTQREKKNEKKIEKAIIQINIEYRLFLLFKRIFYFHFFGFSGELIVQWFVRAQVGQ